jgi:hypothetical protein
VAQLRPFVPRLWKNGLFSWDAPASLTVDDFPLGFRNSNKFGITPDAIAPVSVNVKKLNAVNIRMPNIFLFRKMATPYHKVWIPLEELCYCLPWRDGYWNSGLRSMHSGCFLAGRLVNN